MLPRRSPTLVAAVLAAAVAAGCGSSEGSGGAASGDGALEARSAALRRAVAAWAAAPDVASARRQAERARNLVVGPAGPGYGDADGDGTIAGAARSGLLPGRTARGLAQDAPNACVERDVLGGPWDDPDARWRELQDRIAAWRRDHNTFPELASHAQRVVGWATLALRAGTLEELREYAGHASLHADVVARSVTDCAA